MGKPSIRKAKRFKRRFDGSVESFAWYVGWFGVALLAACVALWAVPERHWDGWLNLKAARLPVYTMVSLLCASLVGWRYVNMGEDRLSRMFGRQFSLWVFLVVPMFCLVSELVSGPIADATGMHPLDHPFWQFVRWYPPVVIALCGLTFLMWKSKPRKRVYFDRGAGYALLLVPYALLFAFMHLGVRLEWLDESMRETLSSLGQWSVALQLVVAYFVKSG